MFIERACAYAQASVAIPFQSPGNSAHGGHENEKCSMFFFLLATFWLSQWSDVLLLYLECDSMTMTFRFSNFHRPPCHSFLLFSISLSIRESWLRNKKIYLWTHLHSSQEIIRYENISNAAHRIGTHESAQSSSPTQFDAVLFLFENSIWCFNSNSVFYSSST